MGTELTLCATAFLKTCTKVDSSFATCLSHLRGPFGVCFVLLPPIFGYLRPKINENCAQNHLMEQLCTIFAVQKSCIKTVH